MSFPKTNFDNEQKIQLHDEDRIDTVDYTLYKKLTYVDKYREYFEVEEINTNKIFFAKILRRNKEPNQEENYRLIQTKILNEVNILRQIIYPTIIKYIGYCPNGIDQKHQPAIVTEYGVNGLLHDVIKNSKDPSQQTGWNDTKKLINIFGITSAVSYLHSINVLHRNLNPTNIYETEKLYPLVGNFENAIYLGENIDIYSDKGNIIGLVMYTAPEIIKEQKYSQASDIYSLGMIIYEIFTGSIPFEGLQPTQICNDILQGKRPEFNSIIPEQWQRLIESCWSENPKARPTADDILRFLREDQSSITPTINIEEYESFIKYIDNFFLNYSQEKEEK